MKFKSDGFHCALFKLSIPRKSFHDDFFYEQAVIAKGGEFLEAPVSGSKQPAEMATLIILAAGSKVHYPIFLFSYFILTLNQRPLHHVEA
jgi:hypothetical protein